MISRIFTKIFSIVVNFGTILPYCHCFSNHGVRMDYAIELDKVSKEWPGTKALEHISFKVKKGSIHGFLGPNGAGKSTTMNIISGLIPSTSGKVKVFGQDIRELGQDFRKFIGFLPEHPPLYLNMVVKDYLTFVSKIRSYNQSHNAYRDAVTSVIQDCSLESVSSRLIGNLSKGYRQRVAIAAALVGRPDIIILDEPTVGLDPISIIEIRELILSLRDKHTILLSTHILHEVSLMCDDITVINNGRILSSGPINQTQSTLNVGRIIRAEVKNWSEKLEKYFMEKYNFSSLDKNIKTEGTELTFYTGGMDDVRVEISADLISNNCGLLSFAEEKIDIENYFKRITEKDNLMRVLS